MLPELKYLFEHFIIPQLAHPGFFFSSFFDGKYLWTTSSQILEALFKPMGDLGRCPWRCHASVDFL